MKVTELNWQYEDIYEDNWMPRKGEPIRAYVTDGEYKRIVFIDDEVFMKEAYKKYRKYPTTDPAMEAQWCELAKAIIEKDYKPMDAFPDIDEASPLTKELYYFTCQSVADATEISEEYEKEYFILKYKTPWEVLKEGLNKDMKRFNLTSVVITLNSIIGTRDLITKFKSKVPEAKAN